jgi:hypothetical protein
MICQSISPVGRGDIYLNNDQIRLVPKVQSLYMLILKYDLILLAEISCQSCQT